MPPHLVSRLWKQAPIYRGWKRLREAVREKRRRWRERRDFPRKVLESLAANDTTVMETLLFIVDSSKSEREARNQAQHAVLERLAEIERASRTSLDLAGQVADGVKRTAEGVERARDEVGRAAEAGMARWEELRNQERHAVLERLAELERAGRTSADLAGQAADGVKRVAEGVERVGDVVGRAAEAWTARWERRLAGELAEVDRRSAARAEAVLRRLRNDSSRPGLHDLDVGLMRLLSRSGLDAKVVYDIGASYGSWSAEMSKVFPHATFHLFEPLADTYPSYREPLRDNLARHPNFILHAIALGGETATVDFWVDASGLGSSVLDVGGTPGFAKQTVSMQPLDEYVARHELPYPDFIKLDVQGFEEVILRNGRRCMDAAKALLVETWLYRGYGPGTALLTEIIDLVGPHGFDLVELGGRYYGEGHRLGSVDSLFVKREWMSSVAAALPEGDWVYQL